MATFSDPYEEWKAKGRRGGTYKPPTPAAPVTSAAPAPAPRPQPQAAAAQPMDYATWEAAARQNRAAKGLAWDPNAAQDAYSAYQYSAKGGAKGAGLLGRGGAGTQEQRQVGGMAYGSFGDDHPDAGKMTGDPYLDELRSGGVANEEDWRRNSNAELKTWEPFYIGGGKFRNKYGDIVSKPMDRGPNTPPGMNGMGQPMGGGRGGAGGGGEEGGVGGGGGAGGGGGQYGPNDMAMYQVKQQYAEALADPTGQKAWQLFAGQGGADAFQQEMDKYRQAIAGMPEGPQRQEAQRQLAERESSLRLAMPQQARTRAIEGLTGIINPENDWLKSNKSLALQKLLGMRGLDIQQQLGLGNLALGQGQLGLQTQGQLWNQQWTPYAFEAGLAADERARQAAANAAAGQASGQAAGQLGSAAVGGFFDWLKSRQASDIRVKEDIAPGRRGLTDLIKLRQYTYRYKGHPSLTQSIMAQDLEKVAPEFVHEIGGIKHVDAYALLGMTMQAVKDLAKKVEKN